MKTLFLFFVSCLVGWLAVMSCYAQGSIQIIDPFGGAPTCTNVPILYSLATTSSSTNLQGCDATWTIVGGREAISGQTTVRGVNNVSIIWNDVPTTIANGVYSSRLSVTTASCNNSAINTTAALNIVTRSLAQAAAGPISLNGQPFSGQLPFGDNARVTLAVPQVRLPYPAGTNNVDYAQAYEWTAPAGWAFNTGSATGTGSVITAANSVDVTPSADGVGTITVRALDSYCTSRAPSGQISYVSKTPFFSLTVTRPTPTLTIVSDRSPNGGNFTLTCGDQSDYHFRATNSAVPANGARASA